MRREMDWEVISTIATEFNTCIAPGGQSYNKALADFREYGGNRISYYTFEVPLKGGQRGYLRTILNQDQKPRGLFVDYMCPTTFGQSPILEVAAWLKEMSAIYPVYLPALFKDGGLSQLNGHVVSLKRREVRKGLHHSASFSGRLAILRLEPEPVLIGTA